MANEYVDTTEEYNRGLACGAKFSIKGGEMTLSKWLTLPLLVLFLIVLFVSAMIGDKHILKMIDEARGASK